MENITELVKYSVTDEALAQYRKEFLPLTVKGLDDLEGYEKVREARLFIKGERVSVERRRGELKEDSLRYGRAVDAEAKRITEAILEVENHLIAEQKKIDDQVARIKFEKEQREKLPERQAQLVELGAQLTEAELLTLDDVAFAEVLNVLTAKKLEQQRVEQEERERVLRAEAERIEAEKKAIEEQRLAEERERRGTKRRSRRPRRRPRRMREFRPRSMPSARKTSASLRRQRQKPKRNGSRRSARISKSSRIWHFALLPFHSRRSRARRPRQRSQR
jgi:hypothetical protein